MLFAVYYSGKKLKTDKHGNIVEKPKIINIIHPFVKPIDAETVSDKVSGYVADASDQVTLMQGVVEEHNRIYGGMIELFGTVVTENAKFISEMFRHESNFRCMGTELGQHLLDTAKGPEERKGRFCRMLEKEFKIGTVRYIVSEAL